MRQDEGLANPRASHPTAAQSPPRIPKMLFHALRLFLGGLYLYASYDKILHPQAFAQAIYNYQILPDAVVNLAALVLPGLELLLGLCLVAGIWLPGATMMSSGLLAVFITALVVNLARGLNVQCGCFSTQAMEGPADRWTVVRDVSLLAVSAYLTLFVFFIRPPAVGHKDR
jgi:uncharacterized membrane protein YphA (DoxX/SURF4 family)